jgi:hypothetical protein
VATERKNIPIEVTPLAGLVAETEQVYHPFPSEVITALATLNPLSV